MPRRVSPPIECDKVFVCVCLLIFFECSINQSERTCLPRGEHNTAQPRRSIDRSNVVSAAVCLEHRSLWSLSVSPVRVRCTLTTIGTVDHDHIVYSPSRSPWSPFTCAWADDISRRELRVCCFDLFEVVAGGGSALCLC